VIPDWREGGLPDFVQTVLQFAEHRRGAHDQQSKTNDRGDQTGFQIARIGQHQLDGLCTARANQHAQFVEQRAARGFLPKGKTCNRQHHQHHRPEGK
jgi:hypothetical protein